MPHFLDSSIPEICLRCSTNRGCYEEYTSKHGLVVSSSVTWLTSLLFLEPPRLSIWHTWEEGTLSKDLPPSDWLMASVGTFSWLPVDIGGLSPLQVAGHVRPSKPVSSILYQSLLRFLTLGSCFEFQPQRPLIINYNLWDVIILFLPKLLLFSVLSQ